ncbi:glycoside hydrolase family 72 protein [Sodiomyces alcalophilus JCM 7366]|uniref:glycoside hydrolase family 72 protein n=1 Tax=Sodiomyces alcalophilus JCM 7366 TaxID=591952 RepID=UPI0039B5B59A
MLLTSALVALGATLAAAVTPLELRGNAFVNPDTGNKFQIVGIDYQINGSAGYNPEHGYDPLSIPEVCLRDAALMQALGVNAIRVYNLNPDLNHDACASIFNAAGMYMLLDVNSPLVGESLSAFEPWTSYYASYLNRTFAIVEAFKNYPNTLLFFSANEVIDNPETVKHVPPYLRALTRDVKSYVAKHSDRKIPVGYSAADVRNVLFDTWNYLQCAIDGDEDDISRVDLFGLNSYSWCGDSDFERSTFDDLVDGLHNTSVPVFFSEYGCNESPPRLFTEVASIYGPNMTDVFSGGLVYEYSQEDHNYGLVEVFNNKSAHLLQDYRTLAGQFAKLDFKELQGASPDRSMPKPPTCSRSLIRTSTFNSNFTLPDMPPGVKELIDDGISPKPSGRIIDISDWDVPYTVYDTNWEIIEDLAVQPLDDGEVNRPGTNTAGSSDSDSDSSSDSSDEDDENAGFSLRPALAIALGLPAALLFW